VTARDLLVLACVLAGCQRSERRREPRPGRAAAPLPVVRAPPAPPAPELAPASCQAPSKPPSADVLRELEAHAEVAFRAEAPVTTLVQAARELQERVAWWPCVATTSSGWYLFAGYPEVGAGGSLFIPGLGVRRGERDFVVFRGW